MLSIAVKNDEGIDISAAIEHVAKNRTLEGFGGGKHVDGDALLAHDCDILVPAALGGVLTKENADDVRAKIIVEGANGPVTANADKILDDKGTFVVPDILANGGGVTVSHAEWVQGRQGIDWDEEEVTDYLEQKISDAAENVREVMQLQKRLLAAQVDARLGWRETQRLHMARMENMAARLGEYTGREQQLSSELHECNVKLELERREHARLRGMHKEMWRETSAARAGRYEAELSASAAAEAATAARDAAVREISKSRDVALTEMARLRAHYESLLASNPKAKEKAESAVVVESLNAELAEARRQRTSVESDLHDALRRLQNSAADLVASRRTIVSLQTALERTNGGGTPTDANDVEADEPTTKVEVPRVPRESGDGTPREFDAPPVMFQTPQPTGPGVTFTSVGATTPIRITDEDEVTESEDGEGSPEMRAMLRASAEARERLEALTRLRFDEVPLSPK